MATAATVPQIPSKLPALTGVRFFAAILVVFYHFWRSMVPQAPSNAFISEGFMGVSLFFVLSGFILAHVYMPNRAESFPSKKFWLARFARVYPVYALAFFLEVPLLLMAIMATDAPGKRALIMGGTLLANLALLQAWYSDLTWRWNFPSWSLSVEAFFYAIFPFIAKRFPRSASIRSALTGLAICYGLVMLPTVTLTLQGHVWFSGTGDPLSQAAKFNPIIRAPEFVMGIFLWQLVHEMDKVLTHERIKQISQWCTFGSLAALILLAFAFRTEHPNLNLRGVLDPIFAALILGLATIEEGKVARFLGSAPLILLGEASYSLYILQAPVHQWYTAALQWLRIPNAGSGDLGLNLVVFSGYVILLTALSVLSYKAFEAPVRKAILKRLGKKPLPSGSTVAS